MGKHRGNRPVPGYFKVSGGKVEDRDYGRMSKQAVGKAAARVKRRAGRKTRLGEAPAAQRAKEPVAPRSTVLAEEHGKTYATKTATRARPRVKPAEVERPHYLGHTAVAAARRVMRYATAPLALARAVVSLVRDRDHS